MVNENKHHVSKIEQDVINLLSYVGEADRKQIETIIGKSSSTIQKGIPQLKKKGLINTRTFNGKEEKYSLTGKSLIPVHRIYKDVNFDFDKTSYCVDKISEHIGATRDSSSLLSFTNYLFRNTFLNYCPFPNPKKFLNTDLVIHNIEDFETIVYFYTYSYLNDSIENEVNKYKKLLYEIMLYERELEQDGRTLIHKHSYNHIDQRIIMRYENEIKKEL